MTHVIVIDENNTAKVVETSDGDITDEVCEIVGDFYGCENFIRNGIMYTVVTDNLMRGNRHILYGREFFGDIVIIGGIDSNGNMLGINGARERIDEILGSMRNAF